MTSSVGKAATFPKREGIFAEWEHFLPFRFTRRVEKTESLHTLRTSFPLRGEWREAPREVYACLNYH